MNYYVLEDEYNDDISSKPKERKSKWLIVILAIIIILVFVIVVSNKISINKSYESIEKEMVSKAKEYVNSNSISYGKEIYVDTSKIDVDIPDNCNILSGVLYKDGEYTPYLLCNGYESKIEELGDENNLVGKNVVLLTRGSNYYELGSNGSNNVQISGQVNINEEGVYNIYYISSVNGYSIRKVIVVDNLEVESLIPVIDVKDKEIVLNIGESYNDNVVAIDKIDGNITNKMIKVSDVDLNEIGEYNTVYVVTNSLGYTTMSGKKIIVSNNEETNIYAELSSENMVNYNIGINIRVIGDNYDHLVLPSGEETTEKVMVYEVEENGEYEFVAYNKDGTSSSKKVRVSNIDKTNPLGTCSATVYNDKVVFSVNVSSFNYVVGYNYIIDGTENGFVSSNNYTISNSSGKIFSVKLKDYIGNENIILCATTDKKVTYDPNGYRTVIRTSSRLRIPISDALAKKGYSVNDLNMCIYKRVKEAGPYTRYGVAAAAFGLIDCSYSMTGYVLSYNHEGGRVEGSFCQTNSDICGKLGINTRWGNKGGSCGRDQDGNIKTECWSGLNCATFVRWALCNGGMDFCSRGPADALGSKGIINEKYFPGADGVDIQGKSVRYYMGNDLTKYGAEALFKMLKPGDVMGSDEGGGHAFVVMGRDDEAVYTAEDGYYTKKRPYKELVNGEHWYRLLFLDGFYANQSNRNHLYN